MPVTGTPTPVVETTGQTYQTAEEAEAMAAIVHGLASWAAASANDKLLARIEACSRIERAYRYQGRKYDPEQALEFPRYTGNAGGGFCGGQYLAQGVGGLVWDLDAAGEAIVPVAICRAEILEADAILAGDRHTAARGDRLGLASQSAGGASESYFPPGTAGAGGVLCPRADDLVKPYRLRTGQLL